MNQGDAIDRGFLGSILSEGVEKLDEKAGHVDEPETLPKMFDPEAKRKRKRDPGLDEEQIDQTDSRDL